MGKDPRLLSLVRAIRAGEAGGDPTVPVFVLGEGTDELELLRAFEAGCDHFVAKPFSYLELRARVRACIRRAREWRLPRRLVVGALVVDRDARKAVLAGRELYLSRLEFDLAFKKLTLPSRLSRLPPEVVVQVLEYKNFDRPFYHKRLLRRLFRAYRNGVVFLHNLFALVFYIELWHLLFVDEDSPLLFNPRASELPEPATKRTL